MTVSLFTLAEILKCLNDQAHHVNTTCMPYGWSAALRIFMPHVNWPLASLCAVIRSGSLLGYDSQAFRRITVRTNT